MADPRATRLWDADLIERQGPGTLVRVAKEAGADFAGGQDLVDKIQKENWLDFDIALPGHGPPVVGRANEKLREYAKRWL